jgi:translation initiation factor 2 beta subunit (eIF-2beta)/eIF-5
LGLFCAVGYYGVVITSPDGILWTQRQGDLNILYHIYDVKFDVFNGIFVATGEDGVMTSRDGINWNRENQAGTKDYCNAGMTLCGINNAGKLIFNGRHTNSLMQSVN